MDLKTIFDYLQAYGYPIFIILATQSVVDFISSFKWYAPNQQQVITPIVGFIIGTILAFIDPEIRFPEYAIIGMLSGYLSKYIYKVIDVIGGKLLK